VAPTLVQTTATRVVNSLADPGDGVCAPSQCTLREAIADPATTAITFAPGLGGTITLARASQGGGAIEIAHSLSITGPPARITVQRNPAVGSHRVFRVAKGAIVTLRNLAIRNGQVNGNGGGIANYGNLRLLNSVVAGNFATGTGGGIDNHGRLSLEESIIARDTANFGGSGIQNCAHCVLTITGGAVQDNVGNGIASASTSVSLSGTLMSGNSGRALALFQGTATLNRVRLARNSGGAISIFNGELSVTDCAFVGNGFDLVEGGGIRAADGSRVTVTRSTFSGNSAGQGGAIYAQAFGFGRLDTDVEVINSTISNNTASVAGGGVFSDNFEGEATARVFLVHTTVVRNRAPEGGGLDIQQGSIFPVNSIVALNQAASGPDVFTAVGDGSNGARSSLIGDGTASDIVNGDGNIVGKVSPFSAAINPQIGPLTDNGGATLTHALLSGSPAIDAAAAADCRPVDQRLVARPRGPACDMGSYER
jgi:CSLREA domain-containing protein